MSMLLSCNSDDPVYEPHCGGSVSLQRADRKNWFVPRLPVRASSSLHRLNFIRIGKLKTDRFRVTSRSSCTTWMLCYPFPPHPLGPGE